MVVEEIEVDGSTVEMEEVSCNLCGSKEYTRLFSSKDNRFCQSEHEFHVVQCKQCDLAYLNPRPTLEAIQVFYPARFFSTATEVAPSQIAKNTKYQKEISKISKVSTGSLLDVGTHNGDFVQFAKGHGWQAEGLENASEAQNPFGVTIHREFSAIDDSKYDVVTSWAVFEHLHDPMEYFRQVNRVLKNGGEFVFLVPNFASYRSRYMGYEDIPRHVYFFTPKTVLEYLNKTGFGVEEIEQDSSIYYGGHRKFLVYLALRLLGRNFQIKHQNNLWKAYKGGNISLFELIYLTPFEHIDRLVHRQVSRLLAKFGRNGTMIVHAKKNAAI